MNIYFHAIWQPTDNSWGIIIEDELIDWPLSEALKLKKVLV